MKRITIKQVDAFTTTPFLGNPAGVVTDANGLSEREMQFIAREMNVSETAFILPPTSSKADVRIRWFTPATEVPLCGHATIAGFHALAEEKRLGMSRTRTYHFRLETKSGILPIEVKKSKSKTLIRFGLPVPKFQRAKIAVRTLAKVLNISTSQFDKCLPIVVAGNIYVPIERLGTILRMKPDFNRMLEVGSDEKIDGFSVFTTETVEPSSSIHSRFFAPYAGINEDPVTGSANGPLGVYLFEHGLLGKGDGTYRIVGEQGDAIGRKGRVLIEVEVKYQRVHSATIGGQAVTVLQGEMVIS